MKKVFYAMVFAGFLATSCASRHTQIVDINNPPLTHHTESNYGKPSDIKVQNGVYPLIPLPYQYDALNRYIDTQTMYTHFAKHYTGYLEKLNKEVAEKGLHNQTIETLLMNSGKNMPSLRNNAGGYYNHNLYFGQMSPTPSPQPSGNLLEAIHRDFGSLSNLKEKLQEAAASQFGSGWAWLIRTADGHLAVTKTLNQDNPLMPEVEMNGTPLLGIDVWEHAYYLRYQNKRGDYVKNFWNVLDWEVVSQRFDRP